MSVEQKLQEWPRACLLPAVPDSRELIRASVSVVWARSMPLRNRCSWSTGCRSLPVAWVPESRCGLYEQLQNQYHEHAESGRYWKHYDYQDAAAASVWFACGNGVILITTKKGGQGTGFPLTCREVSRMRRLISVRHWTATSAVNCCTRPGELCHWQADGRPYRLCRRWDWQVCVCAFHGLYRLEKGTASYRHPAGLRGICIRRSRRPLSMPLWAITARKDWPRTPAWIATPPVRTWPRR